MVVDDEILVREGLRRILETFDGLDVVAVCSGTAAAEQAVRHRPDVVLLDLRMPDRDGLTVLADLRSLPVPPAVALLTTFDADEHLDAALRGGAMGFLLKDTPPAQLEYAVKELARGGSVLAPRLARTVVRHYAHSVDASGATGTSTGAQDPVAATGRQGSAAPDLTDRERDVLALVAEGLSNTEIGQRLFIGTTTVKDHVSALLVKFGVANRVQAAVHAHRLGLVPADPVVVGGAARR
ncbi:response regulator [Streptomyces kanamyceticus]|uniref:DNA-binding response regulator n=1 Tax=Streptomyces kanamyceticus TaxID=1967 RepID=A0A5J6GLG1_STRKN|nr:response regulator transcription factor [Streptomyces kanamyceticus]QEU96760.1 DNA-binding response regulator [Streptomyces kanamyceticus]